MDAGFSVSLDSKVGMVKDSDTARSQPSFRRLAFLLGSLILVPTLAWSQGTYTTSFPATENPISQGGRWINGRTVGLDWTNVQTTPGLAFGTELSTSANDDDSTALLTGTWGPNQTVTATVHRVGSPAAEVEIRLHSSLSAHNCTGYEINFSTGYTQIVRWNGPLNSYTILASNSGVGVTDGATVSAAITSAGVITAYINGTQVNQVTDTTYTGGAPGMGFFTGGGGDPTNSDLGFSQYTATDGTTQSTFTLSVAAPSQTVTAGSSAPYTISVAPSGGFTGVVNLSVSGQPSGATAIFSPSSITTSGSSTLALNTTASTPAATYPLTITGTSGSLSQTVNATLIVNSFTTSSSSSGMGPCDVNKDGVVNVVDVQISADNAVSCSTSAFSTFYSQVVTGVFNSCPATSGLHTVSLSWTASTTSAVTYNVYRATTSGGYTTPLNSAPISSTSFSDCTVTDGQTYYYVIRAVDGSGNQSVNSGEVAAAIPST